MKTSLGKLLTLIAACLLPLSALAQVNSGSDGHDGALNPTSNLVINMADHPDGIYHYTSVNIPVGVTVSFIPNAGNKPVVWLVQGSCTIAGSLKINGEDTPQSASVSPGRGGPAGWNGGQGALSSTSLPGMGLGPGGGSVGTDLRYNGGNASFATTGARNPAFTATGYPPQFPPGEIYGNAFCLPLLGGSGGSGGRDVGGGGGGGALLIAASGTVTISGSITAKGGNGFYVVPGWGYSGFGGGGSGGTIRIVATSIAGSGSLDAGGGAALYDVWSNYPFGAGFSWNSAGFGRIRLDALSITFNGSTTGEKTLGYQPIILTPPAQTLSLAIQSVAGVAVAATPTGQLTTPDVIVPANQQNPVPIVVSCANIPLNTEIIVDVKPANGATVRAVALNTAGTQASSTATVQVNMPRGGGTIQAKAVSGLALTASNGVNEKVRSLADTGWTAEGERFAQVEVTATLGGKSQISYLTESGKRYPVPSL